MKRITVLLFVFFALSQGLSATEQKYKEKNISAKNIAAQEEHNEFLKQVWEAKVTIDYPYIVELGHPAILYTIAVEKDPIDLFKEQLKKSATYFSKKKSPTNIKEYDIQWAWDHGVFSTVKGSDMWLLEYLQGQKNHLGGFTTSCDSKGCFNKPVWLVTQAVGNNGKTVVWSMRLKPKKGKTTEIKLTKDNAISYKKLEKIYDSIIK
jgi:hypothetical protein